MLPLSMFDDDSIHTRMSVQTTTNASTTIDTLKDFSNFIDKKGGNFAHNLIQTDKGPNVYKFIFEAMQTKHAAATLEQLSKPNERKALAEDILANTIANGKSHVFKDW
jgi:hypothetical protein